MDGLGMTGRRMVFWGSVGLLIWSSWELALRVDAMIKPIQMFVRMAYGEKIPFQNALSYVNWTIFEIPSFLIFCSALSIYSLFVRKRLWAQMPLPILCALAGFYSFGQTSLLGVNLWQKLKLIPFILIFVGSVIGLVFSAKNHQRSQKTPKAPPRAPYDPFHRR